jgi:enoyl-CoA hydratase/carnithine racemase
VLGESARLSWPEVGHGMVPSLVISHLQHRTSRKQAWELLALGTPLAVRDALAIGLANRVVPDAEVDACALQLARTLADGKRGALRETKGLFMSLAHLPLPDALRAARAFAKERDAKPASTR